MVERTRGLDLACHGLLILGGLLVCLPIYFAFVVGSHTVGDVLAVPPPWLPGGRFFENAATAWQKGNLGRLLFNSLVVAVGITIGKIAVSLLSAFAIVDAVTKGGPAGATNILVYKVYQDGFVHIDLGSSAAQSVLLMIFAVILTMLQFRYVERNVNYDV